MIERMQRLITVEEFLTIKTAAEGGTVIDGVKYGMLGIAEKQVVILGQPNTEGNPTNKVFFLKFKELDQLAKEGEVPEVDVEIVMAEIIDCYPTEEEMKETVRAFINPKNVVEEPVEPTPPPVEEYGEADVTP